MLSSDNTAMSRLSTTAIGEAMLAQSRQIHLTALSRFAPCPLSYSRVAAAATEAINRATHDPWLRQLTDMPCAATEDWRIPR